MLTSFLISGPRIPEASLTTKDWDKEDIEYLGLFCLLCHQLPYPIRDLVHIFPSLPFAAEAPEEAFVAALHVSHHSFSFRWPSAYLTSSLHAWTMFLYSSWVICPFFYVLYASFLHLSFSFLFIHTGVLPPLLGFQLISTDHFWAWRRWSLKIKQLSWPSLLSKDMSHGIPAVSAVVHPPSRILVALLPSLRMLNCTISWSLQPRLPSTYDPGHCLQDSKCANT